MKEQKTCWYCGCELRPKFTTQDHQHPTSRGGKQEKSNLVDACRNCNEEKGNMTVEEYRTFVWLQRLGSPPFTFEQLKWLKDRQFTITVPNDQVPAWDNKFHGERQKEAAC